MKSKLLIFQLIFIVFYSIIVRAQNNSKKILFIGNSITYFNDMPNLFKEISNSKGKNVIVDSHTPGGTGFVDHVDNPTVYGLFKNNTWDAVVLQPGSGESAGATSSVNVSIIRGKKMMDSIQKYSPCAKVFLYQIPYGVPTSTAYNTYFSVQTRIRDSVTKMADGLRVPFVPAGECTRMHYAAQQDLLLHSSFGDIHPNLNGSYLVAAAMFATIFQENVSGSNYFGGVSAVNAQNFLSIADDVVLPNKPNWRINTFNLNADFAYSVNGNSVDFTNQSVNFDSLTWDFGDGTTSVLDNPTHVYLSSGTKTVKCKAIKNGCELETQKQFDISNLGFKTFENNNFDILYNAENQNLILESQNLFSFEINNISGQLVFKSIEKATKFNLTLNAFSSGIYFVKTSNNLIYKFLK